MIVFVFRFWISIPNRKTEYVIEESGSSFQVCLQKAQARAKNLKGRITGWDQLSPSEED